MRRTGRILALASVLAIGTGLMFSTRPAQGQWYGGSGSYGYPGYSYYGNPGYSYYGNSGYSYYGNGGHDFTPHWHNTQTPFGSFSWYGNGVHDYQPHHHTVSPYGYQGYSSGPFWQTQSYYSPTPYVYMPW